MKKSIISFLLITAFVLSFASCKKNETNNQNSGESGQSQAEQSNSDSINSKTPTSNSSTNNQTPNNDSSSQTGEKAGTESIQNPPKNFDENKSTSIKEIELNDSKGETYKVSLVGNTIEETVNNPDKYYTYQQAKSGDTIIHGSFAFQLTSNNAKDKKPLPLDCEFFKTNPITFNKSNIDKSIVVLKSNFKNSPDILMLQFFGRESSTIRDLYYIKNGALKKISYKTGEKISTSFQLGVKFEQADTNKYVDTLVLDGVDNDKHYWEFDSETGIMTNVKS